MVAPTGYFLERQIKAGIFQKLDKTRLPNLASVWPEIAERLARYDPGNQYAVNYMWGTTGIGYNVRKAREALGGEGGIDSWDIVFNPEKLAKFKDCGVHMLDSADDILSAALKHLGLDPNTSKEADLQKAADLVARIAPRCASSIPPPISMRSHRARSAWWWDSPATSSSRRSVPRRPRRPFEIAYAIPKEGAQLWFDNLAIPRDARNVEEAHAFIDYLQRPEVAAKNSNFISYANGNLASQKFIDKAISEDKTIYPDAAMISRLYTYQAHDAKTVRFMNRLWTRIKTGK